MRRTAFPLFRSWGQESWAGRHTNFEEQRQCQDKQKGFAGSATIIIGQRQYRNTAARGRYELRPFNAGRAKLCLKAVGFYRLPARSEMFCFQPRIWAFERLAPQEKSNLSPLGCHN